MSLKDEIEVHYMDSDGLVSPHYIETPSLVTNASGNGILYTIQYFMLLNRLKLPSESVLVSLERCQIERGLFKRGPHHADQEAVDDYIAACFYLPSNIYYYGQTKTPLKGLFGDNKIFDATLGRIKVKYNYNNVNPGTVSRSSWLGRMPQFVAHLEWASGLEPALWRKIVWFYSVVMGPRQDHKDTNRFILTDMMLRINDRGPWQLIARSYWNRFLRQAWPGGMKEVYSTYFGPEHPLAKYWVD